jgi:hypothetical protein
MNRIFCLFALLCLTACGPKINENDNITPVPKALQEKNVISGSLDLKRGYEDIVESLYGELSEKDNTLKQLDHDYAHLTRSAGDSLGAFEKYYENCQNYYRSAKSYAAQIGDSTLRKYVEMKIAAANNSFKSIVASDTLLKKDIDAARGRLNDARNVLKLVKTLPLMEQYAKEHHPSDAPMQSLKKNYDALTARVKKEIK